MSFKPIALATPKAISGASATLVSSSSAPSAPYPSDTRAKGWRFELDYERIEQSDTWALATPEMRPWLLMLWLTAWKQVPCGSLPASDELIAARIGMDARQFRAHRDILMRGWWLADDGRMYHDTIYEQVVALIGLRSKEKARQDAHRAKKRAAQSESTTCDDLSRVTNALSRVTNAGPTTPEPEPEPEPENTKPPHPPAGGVDRFAEFWEAWPSHKRKVAKAQCEAKWRARGCDGIADRVIAAVVAASRSVDWAKNGGEYIPAPLVWLNQARWEADTSETAKQPNPFAGVI